LVAEPLYRDAAIRAAFEKILCGRDELREEAYTKLKSAFGDKARIVRTEYEANAAELAQDFPP
jgi:hypothetical protein